MLILIVPFQEELFPILVSKDIAVNFGRKRYDWKYGKSSCQRPPAMSGVCQDDISQVIARYNSYNLPSQSLKMAAIPLLSKMGMDKGDQVKPATILVLVCIVLAILALSYYIYSVYKIDFVYFFILHLVRNNTKNVLNLMFKIYVY